MKTVTPWAAGLSGLALQWTLILGTLFLLFGLGRSVPPTVDRDSTLPAVELNGLRFHAETFGQPENPVILVLHGGPGGDYRSLLPLKELADEYFVVFYDQRGSGLTQRVPPSQITMAGFLADLDAFVDHYGRGRPVILLGHSWGAMLASDYGCRYPEKVSAMILAEPGFLTPEQFQVFNQKVYSKPVPPGWIMLRATVTSLLEALFLPGADLSGRLDYFTGTLFATPVPGHPLAGYFPGSDIRNGRMEDWRFGAMVSLLLPLSAVDGKGNFIYSFAERAGSFNKPVLFLCGSENVLIGPEHQKSHIKLFPEAEMAVVAGAGHSMFGEKPAESMDAVRRFLGR
jgi:proline iminopeptidase